MAPHGYQFVQAAVILISGGLIEAFVPREATLAVRWPSARVVETVVAYPNAHLSSVTTLAEHELAALRETLDKSSPLRLHLDHAEHQAQRARSLRRRLSAATDRHAERMARSNKTLNNNVIVNSDAARRPKRSLFSIFGLASSSEVRALRTSLDNEHQAAVNARDNIKQLSKAVRQQISDVHRATEQQGGIVRNHTSVHRHDALVLALIQHKLQMDCSLKRAEAIVTSVESGTLSELFLDSPHKQSGEIMAVTRGSGGAVILHVLLTTYKSRIISKRLTVDKQCCIAEDNGGWTAIPCVDGIKVPPHANFRKEVPAGCFQHTHPAAVLPVGAEKCQYAPGYAYAYICVSLARGLVLGVHTSPPVNEITLQSPRPTAIRDEGMTDVDRLIIQPADLATVYISDEDKDVQTWNPILQDQARAIQVETRTATIIASVALSLALLVPTVIVAVVLKVRLSAARSAEDNVEMNNL